MTYTPTRGPWHVSQRATDTPDAPGSEKPAVVSDQYGLPVAYIALRGTAKSDNAHADAIAALPELIAALERGVSFIADLTGSDWIIGDDAGSRDMRQRSRALHQTLAATLTKAGVFERSST